MDHVGFNSRNVRLPFLLVLHFKGATMIKLSGLSTCLLYSAFYLNSVVCHLYAISQLLGIQTTACGYVYNRELITKPTPISRAPNPVKFKL